MASPLLETKLYVPRPRGDLVVRRRLSGPLDDDNGARLVLVSAPAGFGKTTLLAHWLSDDSAPGTRQRPKAWVSLTEDDRDPVRFWTYVAAAAHRALPGSPGNALAQLSAGRASVDDFLVTFVNEVDEAETGLDLVLDDFHLADSPRLRPGVEFLLEHLPARMRLVISTRVDPGLPLARLRARGHLLEVRAADLRFTEEEAETYLSRSPGLELGHDDVSTLTSRTEGWAAALQLAALSLRGREDQVGFIAAFAGDDRYIVDYLAEEVLDRQPERIREFLLRTSVLDQLSGTLCDAVTLSRGGQEMLQDLDRANLFLVPLDDTRHWYRYHHLFSDVLRTHLADTHAEEVRDLHRRASAWYDQAGDPVPAVRHALAAGDEERAADLVELAIPELLRTRQEATVRGWVDVIPEELVSARPVLAVGFIGGLMSSGQLDGIEERIERAAHQLQDLGDQATSSPPEGTVVLDRQQWKRLPAALTTYQAALSLIRGDPAAATELAEAATARAAEDDHLTRASAAAIAGLARWTLGDLEVAHRDYTACVDGLRRAGHVADVLGCCNVLADIRVTQGRLTEALATYEDALRLAGQESRDDAGGGAGRGRAMRGTADMYVGISQIAWQRNDLARAEHYLRLSDEAGERAGFPQHPYRSRVARARLRQAQGDLGAAEDLLAEAERVYVSDFLPDVCPVPALRARLAIARGDVAAALAWVRARGVRTTEEPMYLREYEHLTLARVLIAEHAERRSADALDEATRLLERLLDAATAGERTGNVIDALTMLALARLQAGHRTRAQQDLRRALSLARPEGHLRVFLDEPALLPLLRAVGRDTAEWPHAHAVLEAAVEPVAEAPARRHAAAGNDLVEPLSDRERSVLRLLAGDLDGPAIARELSVSLSTVRTHTQHIYAKLGVTNRRSAVRAASERGLLHPSR